MTIKLPTSFAGIDGKEAFERIMKKKDPVSEVPKVPEAESQEEQTTQDSENPNYVPSPDIFSRKKHAFDTDFLKKIYTDDIYKIK